MPKVLCVSSSSLRSFMDCRKAYDLTWHRGWEPRHDREAINNGTSFHEHAAMFIDCFAKGEPARWKQWVKDHESDPMLTVFRMYHKQRWDIKPDQILLSSASREDADGRTSLEHPLFLPLVTTRGYDVWIRFTLDFAWRDDNGWINIDDWKTFSMAPSQQNSDLDFQGRGAIALGQRYWEEDRVQFGWRYVRAVAPGSPRGTGPWEWDGERDQWYKIKELKTGPKREVAEVWTPEECYPEREPLAIPRSEADSMWEEMQEAARDLVRAMKEGVTRPRVWYRSPHRGTMPYTCHTCLAKYLCKAENGQGHLDEDDFLRLAIPRSPIEIPDNEWNRWRKPRRTRKAA